jgi:hypothetical protein
VKVYDEQDNKKALQKCKAFLLSCSSYTFTMAFSEHQADRIRKRLNGIQYIEKKMMGGLIFMVRDAMCVGLDFDKKNNQDRLMVRVGQLDYENLLHQKGSSKMDFTGKVMRGFLFIEPSGFDLEEDLDFWISKALEFNRIINPSV